MSDLREIDTEEVVTVPLAELRKRDERIAQLTFQLEQLKRLIYGAKSERFVPTDPGQVTLFAVEATAQPTRIEVAAHTTLRHAQGSQPARALIPAHFPRIEHVIEPQDLPSDAKRIGEEVTEQYHYSAAVLKVDRYVRPKYVVEERIVIAPMPALPFPKSELGASLAAHIAVSKFCDHLPLYRQRQQLKRAGLDVSDSTIGGWFQATATLLEPLGDALKKEVLAQDYLQVDESPIPVHVR